MKNFYKTVCPVALLMAFLSSGISFAQETTGQATIQISTPNATPQNSPVSSVWGPQGRVSPTYPEFFTEMQPAAGNEEGGKATTSAVPVMYEVVVSTPDLSWKQFSAYRKNASLINGVIILGFCDNEKVVLLTVNKTEYVKTLSSGGGKAAAEIDANGGDISHEELVAHLMGDLTAKTEVPSQASPKFVNEVSANCPEFRKK